MEKISCIIVEDKELDRKHLQNIIEAHPTLSIKGIFANALEANSYIINYKPQVVFMDIEMPVINGIAYHKTLDHPPIFVFVTAFSEHAWEGFESQAFDFILKPVRPDRFKLCLSRLIEYLSLLKRADIYDSSIQEAHLLIKEGRTVHQIALNDILYIEALKDYSKVITANKKIITLSKLKNLETKLPASQFKRIHRSYVVATNKADRMDAQFIYISNYKIPIGKTYKQNLKTIL